MRFPVMRAGTAAVLACLSLTGLGTEAFAQAKKPTGPAPARGGPARAGSCRSACC